MSYIVVTLGPNGVARWAQVASLEMPEGWHTGPCEASFVLEVHDLTVRHGHEVPR